MKKNRSRTPNKEIKKKGLNFNATAGGATLKKQISDYNIDTKRSPRRVNVADKNLIKFP